MKVLMLNGSCHLNGCTFTALEEIGKTLEELGIEYDIFQLGSAPIRDCTGCHGCTEDGCVFTDDAVNDFVAQAKAADAFIFGTPVYYAHPSGRILSFLDRAFYSSKSAFAFKPAAAIASARRAGTTSSIDVLNKYFTLAMMPVVSSSYWNMVHGNSPDDVKQDLEGLQIMRNLGRNMAWLMKSIEAGKKLSIPLPENETKFRTNFIR